MNKEIYNRYLIAIMSILLMLGLLIIIIFNLFILKSVFITITGFSTILLVGFMSIWLDLENRTFYTTIDLTELYGIGKEINLEELENAIKNGDFKMTNSITWKGNKSNVK